MADRFMVTRKPTPTVCILVGVLCLGFSGMSGALTYSALPFQLKVVDADTGAPLAGVVANAIWRLENRSGRHVGHLIATEAMTDENGILQMPGWGPLEVPRESGGYLEQARFDPNQPILQLYKQGYLFFTNVPSSESGYLKDPNWIGDSRRHAHWDNKVLRLEPSKGSVEVYMNYLVSGQNRSAAGCLWAKTPRMTAAFINERQRLKKLVKYTGLITLDDVPEFVSGEYCGSKDLVRQYLNP